MGESDNNSSNSSSTNNFSNSSTSNIKYKDNSKYNMQLVYYYVDIKSIKNYFVTHLNPFCY